MIPYCTAEKHEDDTLFLIAEEDFRLHPEHDVPVPVHVGTKSLSPVPECTEDPGASASSHNKPRASRPAIVGADEPPPSGEAAFSWRTGRAKSRDLVFAQELRDLVRICTLANRVNCGEFVWCSWVGCNKRRAKPSHGSTLVALTTDGARMLGLAMATWELGHFDVLLRDWLVAGGPEAPRTCYVYPAVGHYAVHESGCEPGIGVRDSEWNKSWVQAGTRGSQERWLVKVIDKGLEWVVALKWSDMEDYAFTWKTMIPPAVWDAAQAEEYGDLYLPGLRSAIGAGGPLRTKRQRRQFRSQAVTHLQRTFTDDESQAFWKTMVGFWGPGKWVKCWSGLTAALRSVSLSVFVVGG